MFNTSSYKSWQDQDSFSRHRKRLEQIKSSSTTQLDNKEPKYFADIERRKNNPKPYREGNQIFKFSKISRNRASKPNLIKASNTNKIESSCG